MTNKQKLLYILIFISAAAGALLALLLIQEFYGAASGAVKSVCRSGGTGINACRTVAESSYAAIRGLPVIGELPLALLGFVYYGTGAFISILLFFRPGERSALLRIIAALAVLGLIADGALYYVSVNIIKALCPLCTYSYFATAALFIFSSAAIMVSDKKERSIPVMEVAVALRSNLAAITAAVVLLFAAGFALASSAKDSVESQLKGGSGNREALELINLYRSSTPQNIIYENEPVLGSLTAPVKAAIFMDFTCDHCAGAGKLFSFLALSYPGALAVIYKNYPLDEPMNEMREDMRERAPGSFEAAAASICALKQNKYLPFYEAAYGTSLSGGRFTPETLYAIAEKAGLERAPFEKCLNDPETGARVRRSAAEGDQLGVSGTPHIFINGRYIPAEYLSETALSGLIEYLAR